MQIDAYAYLDSPVHTWDVRFKLVTLAAYAFVVASCRGVPPLIFATLSTVLLVVLSRLPTVFVLRRLRPALILFLVMAPALLVTAGGKPIASVWRITFYADGLALSALIALKLFSVVLISITIFGTATLQDAVRAMEAMRMPRKLAAIFLFTYRYIFVYTEIMKKEFLAARLRGYGHGKGIRILGTSFDIMISILIRSYEQSERVYAAMHLRGFSGSSPSLGSFRANGTDVVKSGMGLAACGAVLILELLV